MGCAGSKASAEKTGRVAAPACETTTHAKAAAESRQRVECHMTLLLHLCAVMAGTGPGQELFRGRRPGGVTRRFMTSKIGAAGATGRKSGASQRLLRPAGVFR